LRKRRRGNPFHLGGRWKAPGPLSKNGGEGVIPRREEGLFYSLKRKKGKGEGKKVPFSFYLGRKRGEKKKKPSILKTSIEMGRGKGKGGGGRPHV